MEQRGQQIRIAIEELSRTLASPVRQLSAPSSSIHIWQFPLTISDVPLDQYAALLSEDEKNRASAYRFERDSRRFTVARAMVRSILGSYVGMRGHDLRFDYAHYGKPSLANVAADIRFSVSHSGELGMLGLAYGQEVGVDIENLQRDVETAQLAERYFSEHERASLRKLSDSMRVRAFFRCWTSKEAFLKGQGLGLSRSLESFDVEVNPDQPARLIATRPGAREAELWSLHDIPTDQNYAATAAWEGLISEIKILRLR